MIDPRNRPAQGLHFPGALDRVMMTLRIGHSPRSGHPTARE